LSTYMKHKFTLKTIKNRRKKDIESGGVVSQLWGGFNPPP